MAPWLPLDAGVGTGALPLQILMNDLGLLYKGYFQLAVGAGSPTNDRGANRLNKPAPTTKKAL